MDSALIIERDVRLEVGGIAVRVGHVSSGTDRGEPVLPEYERSVKSPQRF